MAHPVTSNSTPDDDRRATDDPHSDDRRVTDDKRTDEDHRIDRAVDEIVRSGPSGTFAVAGVATAIVVAIYLLFYVIVYLPRGSVQ